jgi:hypothetical protein
MQPRSAAHKEPQPSATHSLRRVHVADRLQPPGGQLADGLHRHLGRQVGRFHLDRDDRVPVIIEPRCETIEPLQRGLG